MKRSEINKAKSDAISFFNKNGWALPPSPNWDITDLGLGAFKDYGLVLVNLAEEPEYCEKLMYAVKLQITPAHYHKKKKEDIICRNGKLIIQLWKEDPTIESTGVLDIKINGVYMTVNSGDKIQLNSGERITIIPYVWHAFYPASAECIIGEVSTANDDLNDNFFSDKRIGRFPDIEEDENLLFK